MVSPVDVVTWPYRAVRGVVVAFRLWRQLQGDADARICLGFKRQQEILSERLREAEARDDVREEQRARRLLHGVQDNELSYHQSRIAELAAHVVADRAPSGAIGPELRDLSEPERVALGTAASALKALVAAHTFDEHLLRGNAFYAAADYAKALEEYEACLQLRPRHWVVLSNRGAALYGLKRYEEALADLSSSLQLQPDDPTTLSNRGSVLDEVKRYAEALADHDRALELRPDDAVILNNRALALRHMKRHEEALADYNRAVKLWPDNPDFLSNRAATLAHMQRYGEALADHSRALELRPHDAATVYGIACLYSLWERLDESLRWLEKALTCDASYRSKAAKDEDFAGLRAHPEFGPRFEKLIEEKST